MTFKAAAVLCVGLTMASVSTAQAGGCTVTRSDGSSTTYGASPVKDFPFEHQFVANDVVVYVNETAYAELTTAATMGLPITCSRI